MFSLAGSPSGCTSATVAGIYTSGSALTASNTVSITVNVTTIGTYAFKTTSANGVYFAASGTFSSTGPQSMMLTGVGTPLKAGSFTYATTNNSGCNFSVSFTQGTGGSGAAIYTFAGAPNSCTTPTVNGTYMNGIVLGATNSVDLNVNVVTAGTYTISTNTASGISFSGTGTFTGTGAQTVRLSGQGTPTATGAATFTTSGGCNFSVTIAPAPAPGAFTYNCATAPVVSGTYTAGTALNTSNKVDVSINVTSLGSYSVTTNAANGVTFSAGGVFTALGAQTITLSSTNTPAAAGSFSYTPSGAGGCAFSVTYAGGGGGGGSDFLKCTIDGVFIDFSTGLAASLTPGDFSASGDNAAGTKNFDLNVTDLNGGTITTGTYNKLSITNINKFCDPTYTPDIGSPLDFWSTDPLNANTFTITIQTITATKVTGIFSGDLFDLAGGNKKVVTGGSFSVTY
ncbi:MAG: hypothetical protein IPP48_09455 [Chitinophagaceae bacterium]|nr:hypothetical protein [Chitinophagaceae bacterium]